MTKHTPITIVNLYLDGESLKSWKIKELKHVKFFDDYRLYFKPSNKKGSGFQFAVVEWISNPSDSERWDFDTEVRFLFNGISYFDGVRHMYLGTNQDKIFGYVNYPNLEDLIGILKEIRELEIEYCSECGEKLKNDK